MQSPVIERNARKWGTDPEWIAAVQKAEGGYDAIISAVACTYPELKALPKDVAYEHAIDIVARSMAHAQADFIKANDYLAAFIDFWAQRWAPVGAKNDPNNLNNNWPLNVKKFLSV